MSRETRWSLPRVAEVPLLVAGLGAGSAVTLQIAPLPGGMMAAALAVVAILVGLATGLPAHPKAEDGAPALPRPRRVAAWALRGTLLALLLLMVALRSFAASPQGSAAAWALYGTAIAVLGSSFVRWGGTRCPGRDVPGRRELLLLALVVALAALPRLYRLGSEPHGVWFDEAQNGLEAARILEEPSYRPVFVAGASQMPALLFYDYALFLRLLGRTVLALRLATTLLALLAVPAVWLLARELFGRACGLIAAALLAISRWHLDFSRFAMAIVLPSLFVPLTLYLFARSQRRESPRTAVLAGITLGIGMQTYYTMLGVPLLLVVVAGHRMLSAPRRRRAALALLALTLAATAFTYAPVLQYGIEHPDAFGQRLAQASIFRVGSLHELATLLRTPTTARAQLVERVGESTLRHLRMFHLEGDANGRHNLPGAPMLDPMTGLFFAIGLAWCLARPGDIRCFMLLLALAAMVVPAILSVDFEAPQAARACGATAIIAVIAAVPLYRLYGFTAARIAPARSPLLGAGVVAAFLLWGGASSFHTYFARQLHDRAVWASFSIGETRVAELARSERDADLYVPETLLGGPTETFLLGRPLVARPFERARDLPLPLRGRRAVAVFGGSEEQTLHLMRQLYPDATFEPFAPPQGGEPLLWIARVPRANLAATRGWVVEYLRGDRVTARTTALASAWRWTAAPSTPPFTARVSGGLRIPLDASYGIRVESTAPTRLWIDDREMPASPTGGATALRLARGVHRVVLMVDVTRRQQTTTLRLQPPDAVLAQIPPEFMVAPGAVLGGLLARYYAGAGWGGEPAFEQIDPQVAFYFHLLPLPRPFSIHWSGRIEIPADGDYELGTSSVDGSRLAIDGKVLVRNDAANAYRGAMVSLRRGSHDIDVWYETVSNYSQVYLYWTPPGSARTLVPPAALRPAASGAAERVEGRGATGVDDLPSTPREPGHAPGALRVRRLAGQPVAAGAPFRLASIGTGGWLVLDRSPPRLLAVQGAPDLAVIALAGPPLADPCDVAVSPSGRIYVLDARGFIQVREPSGGHVRTLDLRPLGVYNPRGLTLGPQESLWIADTGSGRLLLVDAEARSLRALGRRDGPQGLGEPISLARAAGGDLFVADGISGRIQRLDTEGHVRGSWSWPGPPGGLLAPRLAADAAGVVWAAGGIAHELWRWPGTAGASPRSYSLPLRETIVGVAAAGQDRVHLLDASGHLWEVTLAPRATR